MAFFDPTSNHMLSMIAAVYGVFIYSISFSLEMWFIVTSPLIVSTTSDPSSSNVISFDPFSPDHHQSMNNLNGNINSNSTGTSVPIFAFILAALYFIIVMVSLILILGIIIRSMMCVSTWLITILIAFLPEGALVIFVTFYAWNIEERNGQIELCFYVIRAILNIFFVICVQNLLAQWKTDKNASPFTSFGLRSAFAPPSFLASHGITTTTGATGINSNSSGSPYIDGVSSTTINPVFKYVTMRGTSNGNEFDPRSYSFTYDGPNENTSNTFDELSQPYCTLRRYSHWTIDRSDFNNINNDSSSSSNSGHKSRSKNGAYSTQSLDRRKILIKSGQQPIVSTVDSKGEDHEVTLRPLSQAPFDYLQRPGSVLDLTEPTYVPGGGMYSHRQRQYYMSRTLPRDFERGSSSQSLRDIAL